MMVETMFWFHPLVWWIGARLIEECEHACDEDVVSRGNHPDVYAEAILHVCKLYVESPPTCCVGVTGWNLKKRIERLWPIVSPANSVSRRRPHWPAPRLQLL
jgi:beta-lactamase regulating signal transducer with metallopeptidase domain